MRWLSDHAGWIVGALALMAGGVGVYTRSALADVMARVAVLEEHKRADVREFDKLDKRLERMEAKLDRVIERLP